MNTPSGPVHAVEHLRITLETLADALASVDADGLLRLEPELAATSARLADLLNHTGPATDATSLRAEAARAARALARCRRLGTAANDFMTTLLAAHGRSSAYDRAGRERITPVVGAINTRG